jgi:hypothetical protein
MIELKFGKVWYVEVMHVKGMVFNFYFISLNMLQFLVCTNFENCLEANASAQGKFNVHEK